MTLFNFGKGLQPPEPFGIALSTVQAGERVEVKLVDNGAIMRYLASDPILIGAFVYETATPTYVSGHASAPYLGTVTGRLSSSSPNLSSPPVASPMPYKGYDDTDVVEVELEDDLKIPDKMEPVVGYRCWYIVETEVWGPFATETQYALTSLFKSETLWIPGEEMKAECKAERGYVEHHRAPDINCDCGFWAVCDYDDLIQHIYHQYGSHPKAVGRVKGWGKVVEGSKYGGMWKSEFVKIDAFTNDFDEPLIPILSELYNIPILEGQNVRHTVKVSYQDSIKSFVTDLPRMKVMDKIREMDAKGYDVDPNWEIEWDTISEEYYAHLRFTRRDELL